MRIDVMGVGFDSLTMDEAVARARDLMAERRAAYVVTPNPEIVMLCREDAAAMQAVQNADLVLADGIGVIYGAKILGTPLRAKLPGIDFAAALMTQMGREGKRVFLLGAKPGVADAAGEKLRERFPGLVIAGTNDGYFQDDDPVVEKINAVQPDLLLNDAVTIPQVPVRQVPIIHGDARSISIAAASIIAKVTRDRLMLEYDQLFPAYDFASNKGYGSAEHIQALKTVGPCPIHRRSFIGHFV